MNAVQKKRKRTGGGPPPNSPPEVDPELIRDNDDLHKLYGKLDVDSFFTLPPDSGYTSDSYNSNSYSGNSSGFTQIDHDYFTQAVWPLYSATTVTATANPFCNYHS